MNEWTQLEPVEFYEYVMNKNIVDKVDIYTTVGDDNYYYCCVKDGCIIRANINNRIWTNHISIKDFKEIFQPIVRKDKILKIKEKI